MYDMMDERREHDYRDDRMYRDDRDYRNYRNYRDYDRRGGRRNYRMYRDDYYEELEMCMDDMKDKAREIEDIADMVTDPQDKSTLLKIAEREKEHHRTIKEMLEK
jgi:rubrerythrin